MVWKSGKSDLDIYGMTPGEHVMGDIGMLGWVVLRKDIVDIVDFSVQMTSIRTLFEKKWSS